MIEKDLRARNKSTRNIKGYAAVVHRHWPKDTKKQDAQVQKTRIASEQKQAAQEQLRGMDEFSDEDIDLPELEEIFKRASSGA